MNKPTGQDGNLKVYTAEELGRDRGPIINAEFTEIHAQNSESTPTDQDLVSLPEKLVGSEPIPSPKIDIIGERADMAEKIKSTESKLAAEARLEALAKIEAGIAQVQSGEQAEVTIEVSADAFGEYGENLRDRLSYFSSRYGEEKETKKLEKELAAYEKKESSVLQVRESFEFAKQKLEDPSLDPATRTKLEKNKSKLEEIASKLEKKRQSQDRGFTEKNLDWAKENIAGRYLKSKWGYKVGLGIGLSMLTLGASQFVTRPLGLYASYQGLKEGKLSKITNKIKELENSGKTDEVQMAEIEKTIIENSLDKKSLSGAFGLAAAFGALGEYISNTETAGTVANYISDKASMAAATFEGLSSNIVGADIAETTAPVPAGVEEAVAVAAGATEQAASAAASTIYEHASVTVAPGSTMYSILESEFNISENLPEEGRQYNAIENILAQIKANPAEYGITSGDVNSLTVGDTINIQKIGVIVANHQIAGQGIFDHARGLPAAVVSGIENYMPTEAKAAFSAIATQRTEALAVAASGVVAPTAEIVAPVLTGETTLEALAAEKAVVVGNVEAAVEPTDRSVTFTAEESVSSNGSSVIFTPEDSSSNAPAEVFMTPVDSSINSEVHPNMNTTNELPATGKVIANVADQFQRFGGLTPKSPEFTSIQSLRVTDVMKINPEIGTGDKAVDTALFGSSANTGGLRSLLSSLSGYNTSSGTYPRTWTEPRSGETIFNYLTRVSPRK